MTALEQGRDLEPYLPPQPTQLVLDPIHCNECWGSAHLAHPTDLAPVPATVSPTVAYEGGIATQHDVQDHTQAPQVTTLVVKSCLVPEDLYHLWGHVFCRTALWGRVGRKERLSLREKS